jgi:hypothetical protein
MKTKSKKTNKQKKPVAPNQEKAILKKLDQILEILKPKPEPKSKEVVAEPLAGGYQRL